MYSTSFVLQIPATVRTVRPHTAFAIWRLSTLQLLLSPTMAASSAAALPMNSNPCRVGIIELDLCLCHKTQIPTTFTKANLCSLLYRWPHLQTGSLVYIDPKYLLPQNAPAVKKSKKGVVVQSPGNTLLRVVQRAACIGGDYLYSSGRPTKVTNTDPVVQYIRCECSLKRNESSTSALASGRCQFNLRIYSNANGYYFKGGCPFHKNHPRRDLQMPKALLMEGEEPEEIVSTADTIKDPIAEMADAIDKSTMRPYLQAEVSAFMKHITLKAKATPQKNVAAPVGRQAAPSKKRRKTSHAKKKGAS